MAFGNPPKYVFEYELGDMTREHFLLFATEAIAKLNWKLQYVGEGVLGAVTKFSWRSWAEEFKVNIENGVATIRSECSGSQLWDWGKNKKNIEDFIFEVEDAKWIAREANLEAKLSELRASYIVLEEENSDLAAASGEENPRSTASIFIPSKGHFVSPILVYINILIFILMVLSGVHFLEPNYQDLIDWGANYKPLTLDGGWWRLFTACFLHIGVLHLLLNMYALFYIGILLEPYLGKARFLAAYIISGIAASVTSLWWNDLTISAGASGAIFGMYGVFLALLTTNLMNTSAKKALLTSIAVFVGYNILYGLRPDSGIDNAAHIGGLISGIIIGYCFVPSLKKYENKTFKFATIGLLAITLFISSFTLYKSLPNDIRHYEREMERFIALESQALEVFRLPEDTPKGVILSKISPMGLNYWNESLKIINGLESLDLPPQLQTRNVQLKEYCELRIKSFELIYKAINEETDMYQNEIEECNQKIDAIIKSLS